MTLDNGYKYKFTENFIMTCYDEAVNYFADNQFEGKLTVENINSILQVLNKEPFEKWWGTIDELCLLQHFMKQKEVDEIVVVERGVSL